MFGFGGVKTEKKLLKIHVQSIQLPVLDILDEGELVCVYLERSEKHSAHTSEKAVAFLRNGDYGVTFDEDISVPVTMKRMYNGDLKEKLCQFSVRKRKKGSQGQKEGSDAFRIIAWVDIDVKKYCDTNKENYISLKLNWSEKGKDYLGKGALINAVLSVEDSNGDDDDETESVASSQPNFKQFTTTASKTAASTAANKKADIATKDKKAKPVSNPFGDDDEDEEEIHEPKKAQTSKNNNKSKPKEDLENESYKYGSKKPSSNPSTNKKKIVEPDDEVSEEEEQDSSSYSNENSDDENDKEGDTTGMKKKSNGIKNAGNSSTANYTLKHNHKKHLSADNEDDDPFSFNSGRDHQIDTDRDRREEESDDQMKPLVGFPVKPAQLDVSVRSNTSSNGGPYENNPLKTITKGVTGVVGGVVDGVKSGVSGVKSGVTGVVGGVVDGVKGGVNTILRRESNTSNEDDDEAEDETLNDGRMQKPLPKFLTEFKERTYNESAMQRMQKSNFSNLSYSEIVVLKHLEESRLENVSLREKCIDFEMQAFKCEFFANEVARVQDLVNTETENKEKLEAEINEIQDQITSKIEENGYLVDELVSTKAKREVLDAEKRDVMANIESLKLLAKQEKIKRDMLEQKRLKEEREKNSWW